MKEVSLFASSFSYCWCSSPLASLLWPFSNAPSSYDAVFRSSFTSKHPSLGMAERCTLMMSNFVVSIQGKGFSNDLKKYNLCLITAPKRGVISTK